MARVISLETNQHGTTQGRTLPPVGTILIFASLAIVVGFVAIRHSANTLVLGNNWDQQGLMLIEEFPHDAYNELLTAYVDDQGRVDYERWHQNSSDMLKLQNYLQSTSRVQWNLDGSPGSKLEDSTALEKAFWINAYNALTLHAVLTCYPTDSIRHHVNPVGLNVWNHHKLLVGGRAWSLLEIEQECLEPFQDPRIHFCIVRGSVSCPRLRNESFEGSGLEKQIVRCTEEFLANEKHVRLEGSTRVHLNPVIRRAYPDLANDPESLLLKLSELSPNTKIAFDSQSGLPRIAWLNHDWSLNKK